MQSKKKAKNFHNEKEHTQKTQNQSQHEAQKQ